MESCIDGIGVSCPKRCTYKLVHRRADADVGTLRHLGTGVRQKARRWNENGRRRSLRE